MRRDRVFVDTNTLVSSVAFEGNESRLLDLALDRDIKFVIARVVIRESVDVVSRKFPHRLGTLEWALNTMDYELVSDLEPSLISEAARLVRDPGDVEILAGILASKPDYAITGDKDLLTEEVRAIAPTIRCADYLREHWPDLIPPTDNRQLETDN